MIATNCYYLINLRDYLRSALREHIGGGCSLDDRSRFRKEREESGKPRAPERI